MTEFDQPSRGAGSLDQRMEELAPVLRTLPKGTHVAFIQEGNELYLYNINRALELFAARPPTARINVAERAKQIQPRDDATETDDQSFVDPAHAATVDVSYPVMLLESRSGEAGGQGRVIDGWHRIFRASHLGIAELPAIVITAEEEALIRIETDPIME